MGATAVGPPTGGWQGCAISTIAFAARRPPSVRRRGRTVFWFGEVVDASLDGDLVRSHRVGRRRAPHNLHHTKGRVRREEVPAGVGAEGEASKTPRSDRLTHTHQSRTNTSLTNVALTRDDNGVPLASRYNTDIQIPY
jgi:hypothetical protein